ncbi:LuxR family transcriptional regulator [Duganella sp. Leaf61]|uniref:response regulator transcription factor n=1 Tax=Duganella sp. Leaf61 TaxID=1736227 RepID=UPI0006F57825|nr:response regulator [Duganella sp. Leaf61]KQN69393.1 LuxR family transcriptional regulator [Duganella sp. Leaf61]
MSGAQVFLVDDQPAVLKALGRLLAAAGYRVGAYATAEAFLDAGHADQEGCLVLDLSMPGMDGPALQDALSARASRLPVIFLTGHGDLESGIRAMKHGAADFLTKPVDDIRLIAAIELALQRNRERRQADGELAAIRARLHTLTPREAEVMNLVIEGLLNKQIAAALGTVEKTVKVHRARVMAKMAVKSVTALVRLVDRARSDGTT